MPKDLNISVLFDYYGKLLTEKQQTLIDLYYNQDFSLSEIAENEGITRQGVRDGIKRAEILMIKTDEQLELVRKNRELTILAEKILLLAKKTEETDCRDEQIKYIKQIKRTATKIMA